MSDEFITKTYDVVVIGSGAGGGTLAYSLAKKGLRVLIIERGDHIPREEDNWTDAGAFGAKYNLYKKNDNSLPEELGHFYVGGQTKFYGAALYRLRPDDFKSVRHPDGSTPGWPITYEDLEPYYAKAEILYKVHGPSNDPFEPPRSTPYPFDPLEHEAFIKRYVNAFEKQGLKVSYIPRGIDFGPSRPCIFCSTCDAYTCKIHAKMDAETACVLPALKTGLVTLATNTKCLRLITDSTGKRVIEAEVIHQGKKGSVKCGLFVLSAGTLMSAEILLRSANAQHPKGLGNSSDVVGRYLHGHNGDFFMPLTGLKKIPKLHQKTFAINQFYSGTEDFPYPLGVIQIVGQIPVWNFITKPLLRPAMRFMAKRSLLCFMMTESLPDSENRIYIDAEGKTKVNYKANNLEIFYKMQEITKRIFKRAGSPFVVMSRKPIGPLHMAGTIRMGHNPKTSAVDGWSRSHDVENLYVVDMSILPSSGSLNTSLTVIAQAIRVADQISAKFAEGFTVIKK